MPQRILALTVICACFALAASSLAQTASFDAAMALFRQRRWADAAAKLAALEKEQPGRTDALVYRGKCLINLGNVKDAAEALQAYVSTHPQSDDGLSLLGYVQFRQDRPKESLHWYTEAARLKTPTSDDLKIVSLDYVLLNDYPDAAHYLEIALQMDPNNMEARYHLGRVRYQQNRFDDAIAAFQEVLKQEPANVKAEENLGLSYEGKAQMAAASDAYRKAIAMDQQSVVHTEQPYLDLGILLTKSNQNQEAVSLFTKAEQINPKSAKVHYELGKALFSLNRVAEAQQQAEEAIRLTPNDGPTHYLLGRIYHTEGKQDLASQQFKLTEGLVGAGNANSGGMATGNDGK